MDQPPAWKTLLAVGVVATLVLVGLGLLREVDGGQAPSSRHAAASSGPRVAPLPSDSPDPAAQPSNRADLDHRMRALAKKAAKARRASQPTTFTIASFNLLGASHTAPHGNRKGWAGGRQRMGGAVAKLRQHHVSVAGLQELQAPQFHTLRALTGDEYGAYPGLSLGRTAVQNSIIWRRSDWKLVEASTVPIPYFHGRRVPMPYVLLKNRDTGRRIWFANYHNPADAYGPAQHFREAATAIEIHLFHNLLSAHAPLLVTGDMNERGSYACRLTAGVPLHSADGAHRDDAGCHLPERMNVDWIFGSRAVEFEAFATDRDRTIRRVTDHPLVLAKAAVAPAKRHR